jgi:hypothetical protein
MPPAKSTKIYIPHTQDPDPESRLCGVLEQHEPDEVGVGKKERGIALVSLGRFIGEIVLTFFIQDFAWCCWVRRASNYHILNLQGGYLLQSLSLLSSRRVGLTTSQTQGLPLPEEACIEVTY